MQTIYRNNFKAISVQYTKTYPKIHFVLEYSLKVSNRHAVFMNIFAFLTLWNVFHPMETGIDCDEQGDLLYFVGPQENLH